MFPRLGRWVAGDRGRVERTVVDLRRSFLLQLIDDIFISFKRFHMLNHFLLLEVHGVLLRLGHRWLIHPLLLLLHILHLLEHLLESVHFVRVRSREHLRWEHHWLRWRGVVAQPARSSCVAWHWSGRLIIHRGRGVCHFSRSAVIRSASRLPLERGGWRFCRDAGRAGHWPCWVHGHSPHTASHGSHTSC